MFVFLFIFINNFKLLFCERENMLKQIYDSVSDILFQYFNYIFTGLSLYYSYFAAIPMLHLRKRKPKRTTLIWLAKSEATETHSHRLYEAMATYSPATSHLTKCLLSSKKERKINLKTKSSPVTSQEQNNSWNFKGKKFHPAELFRINSRLTRQNGCKTQSQRVSYRRYQIQAILRTLVVFHHLNKTIGIHPNEKLKGH